MLYGIVPLAGFKALASFGVHGGGVSGHRRTRMFATLVKLWNNEDGATAIEYGLIAALIAVAAISAMQLVGTSLTSTFNNVASKL
jgi:pilus assembly protein Flp/PilA